jgi:hypothetical protein
MYDVQLQGRDIQLNELINHPSFSDTYNHGFNAVICAGKRTQ